MWLHNFEQTYLSPMSYLLTHIHPRMKLPAETMIHGKLSMRGIDLDLQIK